jgi:hypothetical protein
MVLFATVLVPSSKENPAEKTKPPRGQREGSETPCGWKLIVRPCLRSY